MLRFSPGHTEAGVRLMELSGLYPAAVLGEMMNDDGTMMRGQQLETFAQQHNLLMCTISDMMEW
jgi:3,4-dihydroxy-2-butanone 4-phosphate synthase